MTASIPSTEPVVRTGTIRGYAAATHRADVQLDGSLGTYLPSVLVLSTIAPAEVRSGRRCLVLFLDPGNPADALVTGIYGDGSQPLRVEVTHNANQSIPNNIWTAVTFNSERFDNAGWHDPAVNGSRLTVPVAGYYLAYGYVQFAQNSAGERFLGLLKNGLTSGTWLAQQLISTSVSFRARGSISWPHYFNAGDYVELMAYQSSGAALNLDVAEGAPAFGMVQLW